MQITYDLNKNKANIAKHQLSFERVAEFNFATALVETDNRQFYGETRYVALGLLDERVHALVFTLRGENIRVISFRKANKREVKRYENA